MSSRDFDDLQGKKKEGWWDRKPAKVALEYLYLQGHLMVSARRNFQRVYDLTERILPSGADLNEPSGEERAEYQITRALRSMGLAREAEIAKYLKLCSRAELQSGLKRLKEEGGIVEVGVNSIAGETYYTFEKTLQASLRPKDPGMVRILSPFDNLAIQRERMRLLFDFDYTIECYVPEAKWLYGYFVCPVPWKNQLVARIDMKADRKSGTLQVKKRHYEPTLKGRVGFDRALSQSLDDFARFNGCSKVEEI